MTIADLSTHGGTLEAAIVCLIIAAIVGAGVYLFLAHLVRVAWAGPAAGLVFLAVLALCFI